MHATVHFPSIHLKSCFFLSVFMDHLEAFNHLKYDILSGVSSPCERKRKLTKRSVIYLFDLLVKTYCD